MKPLLRPVKAPIIGGHLHRSGWPYALSSLHPLFSDTARLVFDDFIEKTICNQRVGLHNYVHSEPWIGICHYPQDTPAWYETEHLRDLPRYGSWGHSLENMRLCITLGSNLASWVRTHWNVPCIALKHPTEVPNITWTADRFIANEHPLLLQVGWYLRNTHAIFQLQEPSFLQKAWLRSRREIAERNHARCGAHFQPGRRRYGGVRELEPVENHAYDDLLASNVVFVELMTSVANNTIVECIARNTPIVVNRLPGPEYYLGHAYPLFYEEFETLQNVITADRIMEAHEYLTRLDKSWMYGSAFRDSVASACIEYAGDIVSASES